MKRTKKIVVSVIAVVLIALAVVLFFVLRDKKPVNAENVTPTAAPTEHVKDDKEATMVPTESVNNDKEVNKEPTATAEPTATDAPTPTEEAGTPVPTVTPEGENPGEDVTPVPLPTPSGVPDGMEVIPAPTFAPTPTPEVYATATPIPTKKPTATPKPTVTPKPTKVKAEYFYEELAKICGLNPDDPVEALKEKGIIPADIDTDKVVREDAFVVMKNAHEYLKMPSDSAMVNTVTEFERLSDVGKLTATEKAAAYYLYANGIVEGVSDGDFTRTRSIKPKDSLSKEDTDLYLARLVGMADKRVLSPDGQVTRTSNLKNMDLYPYLLDSFPDSYYLRALNCMLYRETDSGKPLYNSGVVMPGLGTWVDGGGRYTTPSLLVKRHGVNGTEEPFVLYEDMGYKQELETFVEEYLMKTFNVDYRTTPKDKEWRSYMLNMMDGTMMGSDIEEFQHELIDVYFDLMKKNHTKIECDRVRAEASSIYYTSGDYYIRCYVHYRVVSYDSAEAVPVNTDYMIGKVNPLLFILDTDDFGVVELHDLKAGEWRTGYFDIALSRGEMRGELPLKVYNIEFSDMQNDYSITDY